MKPNLADVEQVKCYQMRIKSQNNVIIKKIAFKNTCKIKQKSFNQTLIELTHQNENICVFV